MDVGGAQVVVTNARGVAVTGDWRVAVVVAVVVVMAVVVAMMASIMGATDKMAMIMVMPVPRVTMPMAAMAVRMAMVILQQPG